MKKLCAALIASAALAYSPAVSAAEIFTPLDPEFDVSGNPFTGEEVVNGGIDQVGLTGSDVHIYEFTIGPVTDPVNAIGRGAGQIGSVFINSVDELIFNSVTFDNGVDTPYIIPITDLANGSQGILTTPIAIYSGVLNTLTVDWTVPGGGTGQYSASLQYAPGGVPEPTTWAMMLLGFAAVGFALRRRRRDDNVRVRYAF